MTAVEKPVYASVLSVSTVFVLPLLLVAVYWPGADGNLDEFSYNLCPGVCAFRCYFTSIQKRESDGLKILMRVSSYKTFSIPSFCGTSPHFS